MHIFFHVPKESFEQVLGVVGQGSLACLQSMGVTESDTTERLNWTEGMLRQNISWSPKQILNLKELKSHKLCSLTVTESNHESVTETQQKSPKTWRLNNIHIKSLWVKEVSKENIFKESNENEHMTYWNKWNEAKVLLRGKFIIVNTLEKKKDLRSITEVPTSRS